MRPHRTLHARTLAAVLSMALFGAGCGPKIPFVPHTNVRPTIELTRAPYNQSTRFEYSYRMDWLGYDPDGRIDHYLYAIDPPSPTTAVPEPETSFVRTMRNEELINFTATQPDSSNPMVHGSSDFHTFVVKAVDNGGLQSAPLFRSFFSYTVAPTVTILSPPPSDRNAYYLPPSVRITWTGTDDDGIFDSRKPVKYKYIMLTDDPTLPVPYAAAIANPDSVRRYYAPRNWAGWDSTSGDTTSVQFSQLTPNKRYCFVVVAFDEAGAYSPVFSLNGNMLNLSITYAAQGGPRLTMYSDIFFYEYLTAQFSKDPQYWINVEMGVRQPLTIHWFGTVAPGVTVASYQWSLDNPDIFDATTRAPEEEQTDLKHWSAPSESNTQATVGPFAGNEDHFFYVKAIDSNGLKSLGTVHLTVVQSTFEKPLAIVDDTRFPLDTTLPGSSCVRTPSGRWPTSAEEDTFLYARGGYPWQCYPAGTMSSPGVFAGYSFDTISTRLGRSEVRVPLAVLGRYSHVIWIVDEVSANLDGPGTDIKGTVTSLRYMTANRRTNSIAAYIQQGGNVWFTGGGAAYASTADFNSPLNDPPAGFGAGKTFMSTAPYNELVPGRMMYDLAHWQSEFKVAGNQANLVYFRDRGRFDSTSAGMPGWYASIPPQMRVKSPATDPMPPLRTNPGDFYVTTLLGAEYLSQPNYIQEDQDPSPLVEDLESTLDTLYSVRGVGLVQSGHNATMTVYRGHDRLKPLIFTGFSMFRFARADVKQLVDAVLQGEWHLPYVPPSVSMAARSASLQPPSATLAAPTVWGPPAVSRGAPVTTAVVQGRDRSR